MFGFEFCGFGSGGEAHSGAHEYAKESGASTRICMLTRMSLTSRHVGHTLRRSSVANIRLLYRSCRKLILPETSNRFTHIVSSAVPAKVSSQGQNAHTAGVGKRMLPSL